MSAWSSFFDFAAGMHTLFTVICKSAMYYLTHAAIALPRQHMRSALCLKELFRQISKQPHFKGTVTAMNIQLPVINKVARGSLNSL